MELKDIRQLIKIFENANMKSPKEVTQNYDGK
jgi:hypothetical protein